MSRVIEVYIVCEYLHGVEDEVHRIIHVTSNRDTAQQWVDRDPNGVFFETFEVDA